MAIYMQGVNSIDFSKKMGFPCSKMAPLGGACVTFTYSPTTNWSREVKLLDKAILVARSSCDFNYMMLFRSEKELKLLFSIKSPSLSAQV